ncbi:hypothetical protein JVT61DRAFT_8617 [Boletus reticuloceps]|uniref:Peptidase C19 ubiquitin carboxyl-terminal hydrolase domain-containing protein n=1 Tax=Boletus reticuloceps TaxID=495285 RepID=A0A8I2Z1B4_9AGAM|nr:hypothetical protein JVT61DRAFT_8617 [Boletus reticuloceps]
MAKPKAPSPQEQYRARKAREEREKSALLPPGLFNHGNTCFMNLVLQGVSVLHHLCSHSHRRLAPVDRHTTLATRHALSVSPIASAYHVSPLPVLTNAHGLSPEHDQPWIDALPIGDQLIAILRTAWDIQNNHKRENISPRGVASLHHPLGKKFDQYLDFRQQDTHEFLCQLLDTIRMEEMDVSLCHRSPLCPCLYRSHRSSSNDRRCPRKSASSRRHPDLTIPPPPNLPPELMTNCHRLSTCFSAASLPASSDRLCRPNYSPSGSSAPRFPLISCPASPGIHSKTSKRHQVPKPTTEEAAYLRDILADINPPNIPKPFSIFKQSKEPGSTSAFNAQNIFLRVNRINRIEECLRWFTSVEVLDGENTVRCHRCWKIANVFYQPRAKESAQDPDSCTESENDEAVDTKTNSDRVVPIWLSANPTISVPSSSEPASPLCSTTSLQYTQISHDTLLALTQPPTRSSSTLKHIPPALQLNDGYTIELVSPISEALTPGVLAVPSISTTTPESPMSIQTAKPAPASTLTQTSDTIEHSSGDSNTESEISKAESETLLSVYSDFSSAASSNASPRASQDQLQQPSPTQDTRSKDKRHPSGVPRSQQYLL